MNPSKQLEGLVQTFVAEVTELARRAALEALRGTGEVKQLANTSTNVRTPDANQRPKRPRTAPVGRSSGDRVRGAKRPPEQLDALRGRLVRLIEDNPGKRAEEINAALGTTTSEIALPLRQLVAEKVLRVEGQRRGSRYFAAKA